MGLVIQVDIFTLSSKPVGEIKVETAGFKGSPKAIKDSLKLLNDPSNSGIDTGEVLFFLKEKRNSGYTAIQGKLKDAENFLLW